MANKKKPTAKVSTTGSQATSANGAPTTGASGTPGNRTANANGAGAGSANGGAGSNGSAAMSSAVNWNRRKTWPLLLGSAAVLGGASVANYHMANPDGKLTDKAQNALSAAYPGAKVRVHGRDAIITDLPPGADRKVAHDLVRHIEGVRNVRQESGGLVAADTTAAATEASSTVAAPAVASDAVVGESTAAVETTVAATTAAAADTTAAPAVVAVAADTTAAADTAAPTDTTAAAETAAETSVASDTTIATTEVPTTVVTTTEAPATAGAEGALSAVEPLLFSAGSAALDADSTAAIASLVETLQQNPDARVDIVGHADNRGTRLGNLAISRARADAVVEALVTAGIDRTRITSVGKGDRLPIASNDTAEGRASNRRVDISFVGVAGSGQEVSFTG